MTMRGRNDNAQEVAPPRVLDCETVASATITAARLIGLEESELLGLLGQIDPEETRDLTDAFGPARVPFLVHWFHATRVPDPKSFFRDGILPTSVASAGIRTALTRLAEGLSKQGASQFAESKAAKQRNRDEGPYGFLFRVMAENPTAGHHNYSDVPEAVEDIAGELLGDGEAYEELIRRFKALTTPCIVKFRANGMQQHLGSALHFLCLVQRGTPVREAAGVANYCYSANGRPISRNDIVGVFPLAPKTRAFAWRART